MPLYRRELLDLKNSEEYRLALEILHESSDPATIDPAIDYFYNKEFGPPEEFERAARTLQIISGCLDSFAKYLETLPEDVDEVVRMWPHFPQVPYFIATRKKSVNL